MSLNAAIKLGTIYSSADGWQALAIQGVITFQNDRGSSASALLFRRDTETQGDSMDQGQQAELGRKPSTGSIWSPDVLHERRAMMPLALMGEL